MMYKNDRAALWDYGYLEAKRRASACMNCQACLENVLNTLTFRIVSLMLPS
jgi:hypothetical protein